MNYTIYTFWEGKLPSYLKLCMKTWKFPYIVLNYKNIVDYIGPLPEKLHQLSLPKIADYIRAHILYKYGGYWLDTDTIMLSDELPVYNVMGYPQTRCHTIGFLYTPPKTNMYKKWIQYQEFILSKIPVLTAGDITPWNIMGNWFTDKYILNDNSITIGDISSCWPETTMISDNIPRNIKYAKFYFESNYSLDDLPIELPNMLMLHNSWTPQWYKELDTSSVLSNKCTLSNILNRLS